MSLSSTKDRSLTAPARTPEQTFSDDRLLNWVGRAFVLLPTFAGCGVGFLALGPGGTMFPGIAAMATAWGLFDIIEPAARGHIAERRVRRLLRRHEVPAVHDVYVSTPDGRRAQLDHVAFLGRCVAVIETKSMTGLVERKAGAWSRLVYGKERRLPGRSPQQQALDARDVLVGAYPAWGRSVLAITVLTHGTLGEGLAGDSWVVTADQLASALGRFRQMPDEQGLCRWRDLERFLRANRKTRSDRLRFWRNHVFKPSSFSRGQLLGFGMMMGGGSTLVMGSAYYSFIWLLAHGLAGATWLLAGH